MTEKMSPLRLLFGACIYFIIMFPSLAQQVEVYPVQGAQSLLVGGVIPHNGKVYVALTKNTSEQVIVTVSKEEALISSRLIFPYRFFVLNTFSKDNLMLTVGEMYPRVNIKEVSFVSLLNQDGRVDDYKLFTVENGFSEIFDAALVNGSTLAITGMGEIKVVTAYSLVPASAMLPQGLLVFASPNLTFQKAYYIIFPGQNKYVWRLYRIEALPQGDIIVAGETYSEWDEERNSPLNTTPFVARISSNGSIKWAFTIPTHGHVNELIVSDDGSSVWLIYTDAKLSGSYFAKIGSEDGKIISVLFVEGFTTNNAIATDGQIICAGKLKSGSSIEAGVVVINPAPLKVYKSTISYLTSGIPEGLKVSPMDIKVFKEGGNLGIVASLLGSTGDKPFLLIRGLTTQTISSSKTVQSAKEINVKANKETNISLEETKIKELKEIAGDLKNENLRIK
ncbi:MAG: hypothetical protein GXO48_03085 [Chlorobi bacterium]|nr:hypothetical protein [Chlorobiota bacterium]